ncbi:MAG: hypothetical protein HQK62_14610 [Desulfamplus sp.]|nr:hypothetical protein [Desulfamplus sp.]
MELIDNIYSMIANGLDRNLTQNSDLTPLKPYSKIVKSEFCDRFADATTAYQGFARGLDMELIDNIYSMIANGLDRNLTQNSDLTPLKPYSKIVTPGLVKNSDTHILKPDLTILFDLDPLIGLERTFKALRQGERDHHESRFEQEHFDFHEKVRKGYLAIAQKDKERFIVVDASLTREEILNQIISNITFLKLSHRLTAMP